MPISKKCILLKAGHTNSISISILVYFSMVTITALKKAVKDAVAYASSIEYEQARIDSHITQSFNDFFRLISSDREIGEQCRSDAAIVR